MRIAIAAVAALPLLFTDSASAQTCLGCSSPSTTVSSPLPCGGGSAGPAYPGLILPGPPCNPGPTGTTNGSGTTTSNGSGTGTTNGAAAGTPLVRPTVPISTKPLVPKPCVKDCR